MSHARIKEVCENQSVYYLITNRISGGRFLFKDLEKNKLKELLFDGRERLCYEVIDYVFMDNHIHTIIKIPPLNQLSESDLLERYRLIENNEEIEFVNDVQKEAFKLHLHDISFVVGNFEQRFTQWFNREHRSWGKLWGARFDSELIEVSEHSDSLLRCMAYVTLNPVRAGIVKDPKDFHFCGYADRVANNKIGLHDDELFDLFLGHATNEIPSAKDFASRAKQKQFQRFLRAYMLGLKLYKSIDSKTVQDYLSRGGSPLDWDDIFTHKCRFFTKCLVIGSEAFIRDKLNKFGDLMHWKRDHQPYTEDEWNGIHSLKPKRGRASP